MGIAVIGIAIAIGVARMRAALMEFLIGPQGGGVSSEIPKRPWPEEIELTLNLSSVAVSPKQSAPIWEALKVDAKNVGQLATEIARFEPYCDRKPMAATPLAKGAKWPVLAPGEIVRSIPVHVIGECEGRRFQLRVTTARGNMFSTSVRWSNGRWK